MEYFNRAPDTLEARIEEEEQNIIIDLINEIDNEDIRNEGLSRVKNVEEIVYKNGDSTIHHADMNRMFKESIQQKVTNIRGSIDRLLEGKIMPIQTGLIPDGTLSERRVIATLPKGVEHQIDIDKNYMIVHIGKMGSGKTASMKTVIASMVENLIVSELLHYADSTKFGSIVMDIKGSLQKGFAEICVEKGYVDDETGRPKKFYPVTPVPMDIAGFKYMPSTVNFIGVKTPVQFGEKFFPMCAEEMGGEKDYFNQSAVANGKAIATLGGYMSTAKGLNPTLNNWVGHHYRNFKEFLKNLHEFASGDFMQMNPTDQLLYYFGFEVGTKQQAEEYRQRIIESGIPYEEFESLAFANDERLLKHFDKKEIEFIINKANDNAEIIAASVDAIRGHLMLPTDQRKAVDGVFKTIIAPIFEAPIMTPNLGVVGEIHGSQACHGVHIAVCIGEDYKATAAIVSKVLKEQKNEACINRGGAWVNTPGQTLAVEFTDEESTTGVSFVDVSFAGIMREIGGRKILATQSISQYLDRLGEDQAYEYLSHVTQFVVLNSDNTTRKYISDICGYRYQGDILKDEHDVPSYKDVDANKIASRMGDGMTYDRHEDVATGSEQNHEFNPSGSRQYIPQLLFAGYEKDSHHHVEKFIPQKAFVITKIGGYDAYEWCDVVFPFLRKQWEEANDK